MTSSSFIFYVFQQFFIAKNLFFLGGGAAYQVLYQEIFQKILLKIMQMDVQDEQILAEDILSTIVTACGHHIVQKMLNDINSHSGRYRAPIFSVKGQKRVVDYHNS